MSKEDKVILVRIIALFVALGITFFAWVLVVLKFFS